MARWKNRSLPGTSVQVSPPSTVLKMPTPASESLDALGSPVAAYSVLPDASAGSISSDPIALVPKVAETNSQFDPFSALSVRHTPPPAAATYRRHWLPEHVGEMAIAVTRPLA